MIRFLFFLLFSNVLLAQTVTTYFSDPNVDVTDAMVFDSNGNLYGSDFNGDSVYKITPSGVVTTFVSGLSNPNGLAFDSNENLFIVEYGSGNIHKYDLSGNLLNTYFVGALPSGIIKDYFSDNMVFTKVSNDSVNLLTEAGDVLEIFQGAPLNVPVGLAYDQDGTLFVANFTGREIHKLIGGTATYVATLPDGGSANSSLGFIAYANGKLWGTVFFNASVIYEIDPNLIDEVILFGGSTPGSNDGPIGSATFNQPNGILYNNSQNAFYISEFSSEGNIRRIDGIPLAVEDYTNNSKIILSPNPTSNYLNLKGRINNQSSFININIYNTTGQLIKEIKYDLQEKNIGVNIDVSSLKSGLYFVKINSENGDFFTNSFIRN